MLRILTLLLVHFSTSALADIKEARGERMMQSGETLTVTAQCPAGLMVTGGGHVIESFQPGKIQVVANLAAPNQSWSASILATQPQSDGALHVRLLVTAVCFKL